MTILAVETSCDETSAAIIHHGKMLSNVTATQDIHEQYGGVVPELASRAHQSNIIPVVEGALKDANIAKNELKALAFTQGPGLLGALLVGNAFIKGMALSLDIPLIGVHHMQAHVLAHFIEEPRPMFPFLCLTVSGGHTQIVLVKDYLEMEVIGETRDDAVGEAFDKSAKLLNLPYPGGPLIDQLAKNGDPQAFNLATSEMPDLDFSFSGIKTSFLYLLRDEVKQNPDFIKERLSDLAASIQCRLIDMLLVKVKKAAHQTGIRQIAIAGGVSANSELRTRLTKLGEELGWSVFIPKFEYCTDNAAMVAMAAHYKYQEGQFLDLYAAPDPRLTF